MSDMCISLHTIAYLCILLVGVHDYIGQIGLIGRIWRQRMKYFLLLLAYKMLTS
jgi:hypothetical protein